AMTEHPEMVGGTDRFDTDLMVTYKKQIVAKGGAEGVHCFGDRETGLGVAIKVEDGNGRGTSVASMEVLRQLKIGEQGMLEQLGSHKDILNTRDNGVGKIDTGLGGAIEVEDGHGRGTSVAYMEVLRRLKVGEQGMVEQLGSHKDILNPRDNVVGKIGSDFSLNFT